MIHSWWMRERLQSLLDDELSETRRAAVAGHLQRCPRCAAVYQQMADGDRLLMAHDPCPPSLSPAAAEALFERALVDARLARGGPWRGMTLRAWGFAALLVIAASGAAAWWSRPDPLAGDDRKHPSPLVRFDDQGDGAKKVLSVADNSRYASEGTVRANSKHGPTMPVRHTTRRHDSKRAPVSTGAAGRLEPQRHPRWPSHRLMAIVPPRGEDQLVQPEFGEGLGGTAGLQLGKPIAQPGSPSHDIEEPLSDEQSGDREAVKLVSAALDGDGSALRRVTEALDEQPAAATEPGSLSTGTQADAQAPDLMAAEWPLPWPAEQPEAQIPEAILLPPQLLVMVSTSPAPSPVRITIASEDTPGFAQVVACRPDAAGRDTWMQATATTNPNGTQTALVMLGDEAWDW